MLLHLLPGEQLEDIASNPDRGNSEAPSRFFRAWLDSMLAEGSRIRVHLNGTPVIDAVDTTYPSGLLGVNVFDGAAEFQGLTAFDSVRD